MTETAMLHCIECGLAFDPAGSALAFDAHGQVTRSEQWGTPFRRTRNGPVCWTCIDPQPAPPPPFRDTSLHEAWEASERALAEWKDPDDWTTADEQRETTTEDALVCFKEAERRYLMPGSRGSNKSGKRFGKKQATWKKPTEEVVGW